MISSKRLIASMILGILLLSSIALLESTFTAQTDFRIRKMQLSRREEDSAVTGVKIGPNKQLAQSNKIRKDTESNNDVYRMMTKDYNVNAKGKPPINNHQPFVEVDEEP